MARKKKVPPAVAAEPPQKPALRARTGQNLNIWLSDPLMDAFEMALARSRRTKTAEVEVMMEAYLAGLGLWPPPEVK